MFKLMDKKIIAILRLFFCLTGSYFSTKTYVADKCVLPKDQNEVTPVRLIPAAPRSRVKLSSTEPLRSRTWSIIDWIDGFESDQILAAIFQQSRTVLAILIESLMRNICVK